MEMIPETTTVPSQPAGCLASVIEEDKENRYKAYRGEPLATKIGQLVDKMNISISTV
jgi:hypothetical protein